MIMKHDWKVLETPDFDMSAWTSGLWTTFRCNRCNLLVECDRPTVPEDDPKIEQDCNLALAGKIMDS